MLALLKILTIAILGQAAEATPPPVAPHDPPLAARAEKLTRATAWKQVAAIPLRFDTFHPQGMVRIGNDFYLSSVEIKRLPKKLPVPIDGHPYDAGVGVGHLFKIRPDGRLLDDLILGEGPAYHPGGIDYDGTSIWVPVAEYRPDSHTIVYRVSPASMLATKAFIVADHIGGVVHDILADRIEGVSWGSRRFYSWPMPRTGLVSRASTAGPIVNPEHYIDYQDCHYAPPRRMLCGGVAEYRITPDGPAFQLGGIDLIDLETHRPIWQAPIMLWAPSGRAMTQNPFWMETTATGLRAYFIPDDDRSTLFVFDAALP